MNKPAPSQHMETFRSLVATRARRALTSEEEQRLELVRDLLLEERVGLDVAEGLPRRAVRAPLNLDVAFQSPNDAARAFARTRDIGTGGMSFSTTLPLEKGATLELSITVPGLAAPLQATAEVMWARGGAVGLAFKALDARVAAQVKGLVTEHSSFFERWGVPLGGGKAPVQAEVSARREAVVEAAKAPAVAESAARRRGVLVQLRDGALAEAVVRALGEAGYTSHEGPGAPAVLVADSSSAFETHQRYAHTGIILVNVSGPESLVGRLSGLVPLAFIPRPATDAQVVAAVRAAVPVG